MQGDEIGPREEIVEFDLLDREIGGAFGGQVRIVGDHTHLQPLRSVGNDRADVAGADKTERLAVHLHPHEAGFFPFAGVGRFVGFWNLARRRQQHRDRVFGRRDRIAERRVHDDDAACRGSRNIDVVDANPGPADDLEAPRRSQDISRHLGGGAHDEAVVFGDAGDELVGAEPGLLVRLDATGAKDLRGGGAHLVGNEDFWHS